MINKDIIKKKKKDKEIDENSFKFEIATELGLDDKIRNEGWASLTAKESGRIGGIITSRKSQRRKQESKAQDKDG